MTFLHTRDGIALVTTCTLCGMSTRSLSESAIYLSQRAHTWQDCARRRAERARANSPEGQAEARAKAGDGWLAESDETCCVTTVFGVVPGVEQSTLKGHKAAPITSRGLTAKTVRSPDGCP
jgi:hypothetical protein